MTHDKDTEAYQETAALYALGALSQHEARSFERHLREGCPVCETELAEFEEVVGELGLASPTVIPSPHLRDLLSNRIATERQEDSAPNMVTIERTPRDRDLSPKRHSSTLAYLPWAVAASFAILALVSIFAWRQAADKSSSLDNDLAMARNQVGDLREQLLEKTQKSNQIASINAALKTPGTRVLTLAGQPPAPGSSANIYWDVKDNQWVVEANLPPAPEGKVYQLWFVTADAKISAGTFKPDSEGHGFAVVHVPSDLKQLAAAAITLEPEGGSEQPTMPIYAVGKV